jgi:hypothetical protein
LDSSAALRRGPEWQGRIRNKEKRRKLANRFNDTKDPFRIGIVREGDAPEVRG